MTSVSVKFQGRAWRGGAGDGPDENTEKNIADHLQNDNFTGEEIKKILMV